MKLLFLLPRHNLDLMRGDSVYSRRMLEGLVEAENEVHAIAHGSSKKIFVHSPGKPRLFRRVYLMPYTNYLKLIKLNELLKKHEFDLVINQNFIVFGENGWFSIPQLFERRNSLHGMLLKKITEKHSVPLLYKINGMTERNSFVPFYAGETREIHLKQLKESQGIIMLSKKQKELLEGENIRNKFFVFYPSLDTKKFKKIENCNYIKKKFGLNDFNLLFFSASHPANEMRSFFSVLSKTEKEINLVMNCGESRELNELINEFGLRERVKFIGKVKEEDLVPLMSYCKAGVYLKKFALPIADASTIVKISEYMACSLPILIPEMSGPIEQMGEAGIVMDENAVEKINELYYSESLRKKLEKKAREKAEKEFDLEKNSKRLSEFFEGIAGERR
ncbi:MAG: glycosyltransferase family 4 protein [archaeon]